METLETPRRTVGLFDIGTNSVRLSVVQIRDGAPVVVNQQREMVRLGEGEFGGGELQPEAMDPVAIKRQYGDRLAFWGTIGVQSTMPFGTPNAVRAAVRHMIETVGKGGGLVLAGFWCYGRSA